MQAADLYPGVLLGALLVLRQETRYSEGKALKAWRCVCRCGQEVLPFEVSLLAPVAKLRTCRRCGPLTKSQRQYRRQRPEAGLERAPPLLTVPAQSHQEWSTEERAVLELYGPHLPVEEVAKRFPGRSLTAVLMELQRSPLLVPSRLSQPRWSALTGYSRRQWQAARRALRERLGVNWLKRGVTEEQGDWMATWLKNQSTALWSPISGHAACISCGTNDLAAVKGSSRAHRAHGRCNRCYSRRWRALKEGRESAPTSKVQE